MKTNKDLIIEPNAAIEGRKYSEEKPWSCKYCYWWGGKKKGCSLKQCHYLLPEKKKAVKTTPCGSEVPGNGQPQETESNAGENGRKDRTGSGERKGKSPKKD